MAVDPNYIQLTPEQQKRLAELAERTGKRWPEVFTEALESYRPAQDDDEGDTQKESLYDVLSKRGMLGCFDGPTDLATNPKHMDGFGRDGSSDSD